MLRWKALAVALAMGAMGLTSLAFATAASANTLDISIGCTAVTFNYGQIPAGGGTASETIRVNGNVVVTKTFSISSPSSSDIVPFSGASDGDTVSADSTFVTSDGTFSNSASTTLSGCGSQPPPKVCPQGTKLNFRWHYSANGSSGSWSGTKSVICPGSLTMGPQAMEGDLKVSPGTTLNAGYDFTAPGNHSSFSVAVANAQVVFAVKCVSGATPSASTLTVPMPDATYSVVDDKWYPSGDQHSPLVYQGSISVPDLCNGGQLRLQQGGTFTASVS